MADNQQPVSQDALMSLPAESDIIGSILGVNPDWATILATKINRTGDIRHLFFGSRTSAVVAEILDLHRSHMTLSPDIISERLRSKNLPSFSTTDPAVFIQECILNAVSSTDEDITATLDRLATLGTLRNQVSALDDVIATALTGDSSPTDINNSLMEIATDTVSTESQLLDMSELYETIESNPRKVWALSTLLPSLDTALGGKGIESGTNVVIGARGKVGKTTFMLSLISAVAGQGDVALVMNFETQQHEFLARLVAFETKLDWKAVDQYISTIDSDVTDHTLSDTDKILVDDTVAELQKRHIFQAYGTANTLTPADIEAHIVAVQKKFPDKKIVLFVDYIQLQVKNQKEHTAEITHLSQLYKQLAVKYNIGVVYLTQMNRSGGDNFPPAITNIASSDSISRDADAIILLDRPAMRDSKSGVNPHTMVVDATHTRLAEGSKFDLYFSGSTQTIIEQDKPFQSENLKQFTDEFDGVPGSSTGDVWGEPSSGSLDNWVL